MRQRFYYKMQQILLQNEATILLQNATDKLQNEATILLQNSTKGYYKMRQLLQNVTFIINCDSTFTM